jgi:uncharacterized protein (DUF342 family)
VPQSLPEQAEARPQPQLPRQVLVHVSRGGLEAIVSHNSKADPDVPVRPGAIREALAAEGIRFGVDQAAIAAAADGLSRGQLLSDEYVVASGRAPQPGADACITYDDVLTDSSGRPKVNADGSVNLFELHVVHSVEVDQVVATRTPPTEGVPGMNVRGDELPAVKGRDRRLVAGKGAVLNDEATEVRSTVAGHAMLRGERIEVSERFVIPSNVGPGTGNINFAGTVTVRGDIQAGYSVTADRDVEVHGTVEEGGTVVAGGSVNVRYGIFGRVQAAESVKAAFIENASVEAGENVWASGGIVASNINAGACVEALGPRGAIISGTVTAREAISARALGAPSHPRTVLHVGIAANLPAELKAVCEALQDTLDQRDRVLVGLQQLGRLSALGALPEAKAALASKLCEIHARLTDTEAEQSKRRRTLEHQMRQGRAAYIQATQVAYPGVDVSIGSARAVTNTQATRVRFVQDDRSQIQQVAAR